MSDIFLNHVVLYCEDADELALYGINYGVEETQDYHTLGYAYSPADAQRFAASRDMLKALEAVYKWWTETPAFQNGEDDMPAEIFDAMRDAIKNAKKAAT